MSDMHAASLAADRSKTTKFGKYYLAVLIAAAFLSYSDAGARAADRPHPQTAEWEDPQFQEPYIDVDEWRDKPVRHRYVHGGFRGTDLRFSLYFPPAEQYDGRFFHYVNPTSGTEHGQRQYSGADNPVAFSSASGAFFVESNLGRMDAAAGPDGTLTGFRSSAAVAKYARGLAIKMYGGGRPYGYMYGGSGGGWKTMSAVESTTGIWDGSVPFIIGSAYAQPLSTARNHALRVLGDKIVGVVDAIDPGGSGDMYAGLNEEERAALLEADRFGFPRKTWAFHESMGGGGGGLGSDASYLDDFWNKPGYAGYNPTPSILRDRIHGHKATIVRILTNAEVTALSRPVMPPTGSIEGWPGQRSGIQIKGMPKGAMAGASLTIRTDNTTRRTLSAQEAVGDVIIIGGRGDGLSEFIGQEIQIDNSNVIARQTFHRHQVPPGPHLPAWDQFKKNGKPIYPQRDVLVSPRVAWEGSGSVQSGDVHGKMIVVSTLMDELPMPWNAIWYRKVVEDVRGKEFNNMFRHWFVDHALHSSRGVNGPANTRIINYNGVLQQALRDLAAWVEDGVPPAASSAYRYADSGSSQVLVPDRAADRKGVQPVVTLTANGAARADVAVGAPVTFSGVVEVPPGQGAVMQAEWDFEGKGDYPVPGKIASPGERVTVTATYSFSKPGTYFPALRVGSQRKPDGTGYAVAINLGRVRVVVK